MLSTSVSKGVILEQVHFHVQYQILLALHVLFIILLLGLWEIFYSGKEHSLLIINQFENYGRVNRLIALFLLLECLGDTNIGN